MTFTSHLKKKRKYLFPCIYIKLFKNQSIPQRFPSGKPFLLLGNEQNIGKNSDYYSGMMHLYNK